MRSLSENTKVRIVDFVDNYYFLHGFTPTISQIAKGIHVSDSTVHKYLHRMTEQDLLSYDGRHVITPNIKLKQNSKSVQIMGDIACGNPIYAEQQYEDIFELPASILGSGNYFILKATGESMVNVGIKSGDNVVIKAQDFAEEGDIIAAIINDEDATLKRFFVDESNKKVVLKAENDNKLQYKDIVVDSVKILGVAKFILKTL